MIQGKKASVVSKMLRRSLPPRVAGRSVWSRVDIRVKLPSTLHIIWCLIARLWKATAGNIRACSIVGVLGLQVLSWMKNGFGSICVRVQEALLGFC